MGQEKKKNILDRAIDAVTSRDEKQAAEAAQAQAAQEAAQRVEAEARAQAAEKRAREAEARAQQAQTQAAEVRREAAQKAFEERVAAQRAQKEAEEEAQQERIYVVKPGDSLSKIAKAELGNANRYPEIVELNRDKIKDPNLIYPGQEFVLPKE